MAWSYVICKLVGRSLNLKVPAYFALLVGALPDFDIYFQSLGVAHHTYTHSIIVWAPVFLIVFLVYGVRSLPYVAGVAQHVLISDFLVGTVPLLLPLSGAEFGLSLGVLGRNEAVAEVGMLVLAVVIAYRNGELRSALSVDRRNVLMCAPLIVLVSLTILFANESKTRLLEYGFASGSLTVISVSHILLACFLVFSTLQGIRGHMHRKITVAKDVT